MTEQTERERAEAAEHQEVCTGCGEYMGRCTNEEHLDSGFTQDCEGRCTDCREADDDHERNPFLSERIGCTCSAPCRRRERARQDAAGARYVKVPAIFGSPCGDKRGFVWERVDT